MNAKISDLQAAAQTVRRQSNTFTLRVVETWMNKQLANIPGSGYWVTRVAHAIQRDKPLMPAGSIYMLVFNSLAADQVTSQNRFIRLFDARKDPRFISSNRAAPEHRGHMNGIPLFVLPLGLSYSRTYRERSDRVLRLHCVEPAQVPILEATQKGDADSLLHVLRSQELIPGSEGETGDDEDNGDDDA